ncbi:putative membrane protein YccC [Granulicella aggregans]|uniref:Putative membrane protein YccC n=1 Tax=Granulicella aggregans TaxID=474949 RepID=A0A7W7ZA95_9BACT|nr:FUSC family protein [Granulicella aggregans]MBB5056198.1 putative membrane protein YccC [Granulicella aggregans]
MGVAAAIDRFEKVLKSLQWARGLRAGVAVAGAMTVCRLLGLPMGWAALGGFEAVLVDNGGPYRSRLETMATLLAGGSLVCVIGAMVGGNLWTAVAVTAAVCFAATFARVASERIASTSVIILVLYFAGFGGADHSFTHACAAALEFVLGGVWAAALSLVLWPVDPFRPARREVAECYTVLAEFSGKMLVEEWAGDGEHGAAAEERRISLEHTGHFQRAMRLQMEKARHAVGRVPARMTARTVRARNLTVLLETADMLFAITMRWRELAEVADDPASFAAVREAARWLSGAEWAISRGLRQRPGDGAASYTPEGSHSLEHVQPRLKRPRWPFAKGTTRAHLAADERDALENVQIAFEAVHAVWSGVELRVGGAAARWEMLAHDEGDEDVREPAAGMGQYRWVDALRANWTFDSVMMRHALRMAVVGGIDIVLMRLTHVRHGSWLAMTSIIVLQPYGSGTLRRGMQRVGGTIAGGVLAAVLATAIHGQAGLIAVLAVVSALTLATYAVNYAWYCFFLTPTFVLMSMPYFHDWSYAAVRMANTVLGALVAVLAMRLLWPEHEHLELGRLLGRGASADAGYLRAMTRYWQVSGPERAVAERQMLAPARRLSGLAINDAEESLDRMMLEPGFGRKATSGDIQTEALTFVTYLRRLMRVATTLTTVGSGEERTIRRVEALIARLEATSAALLGTGPLTVTAALGNAFTAEDDGKPGTVEQQQMRRMERQVGVLERTSAELLGKSLG